MATAKVNTAQAVQEINTLIDKFNSLLKTTGQVGSTSAANFRKVETALKELQKVSNQTDAAFEKMNKQLKNLTASQKNFVTQTRNLKNEVANLNDKIAKQSAELEKLKKKQDEASNGFKGMLSGAKALISAFGIISGLQIFAALVTDAYRLTKQFDSLKFSMDKITQDSFDVAVSQRFLLEITQSFGASLIDTAQRWIKFNAAAKQAGVTLKDTEDIFKSVTKAGTVLGLQTDELSGIYLALEQMMSKGKVTTEELRRQLGERLPGAVGIMAAAVGVNITQLDSMLKKGEILSAEALPKFAKALELAYGIENVDRIDNIQSAQTRLTNAWQIFVKNVMEGNTFITKTLNGIGIIFDKLTYLVSNSQQRLQADILRNKKEFEGNVEASAKNALNSILKDGDKYFQIERNIEKARDAIRKAKDTGLTKEQKLALEKKLADNLHILTMYNTKVDNISKAKARREIEGVRKLYDEQTAEAQRLQKEYDSKNWFQKGGTVLIDKANADLAKTTAKLEVYRKLTEESKVATFPKKDEEAKTKKTGPANYELKDIANLDNEIRIARLNAQKELNEALINSDKILYVDKIKLIEENATIELDIAKNQQNEANDKAKLFHANQLEDLAEAKAKGRKIEGNEAQWRKELDKELADRLLLSQDDYDKKKRAAMTKQTSEIKRMMKLAEEEEIEVSENLYNIQIIAAKKEYAISKKTAKDKEKLDKAYSDIAIASANARIDILIKNAEALLALEGLSETEIENLQRLINELKASYKDIVPEDTVKDATDKFETIMELVSKYADAIEDLGNSIFDRKLENIDAEIEAEKNKFDRLIGLAKNNKSEQERLEAEKKLKVDALEKERLKTEQKKAKFDKVMAIAQIAINTAVAVSKVAAQTGIFAWAGIGPIILLGALQTAAVLAQPIPKYKDGLPEAKTDHVGMINDGGQKEYIKRDGKILSTDTKNAIVQLKKGDTVYKSYDDMVNSEDVFNNISKASILTSIASQNQSDNKRLEDVFDRNLKTLSSDLKNGIKDGFKKVVINNHTSYNADWLRYKNNIL